MDVLWQDGVVSERRRCADVIAQGAAITEQGNRSGELFHRHSRRSEFFEPLITEKDISKHSSQTLLQVFVRAEK
jgi:hypothetical protein